MRLIDADALMDDRKENGIPWHLGESESFRRLVERQPTIQQERTADHVKAEVIGKVRQFLDNKRNGYNDSYGHDVIQTELVIKLLDELEQ